MSFFRRLFGNKTAPQRGVMVISFRLLAELKQDGEWMVAYCPALDVTSQGKSRDNALAALTDAVGATLEYCIENNTIDQVLRDLGFSQISSHRDTPPSHGDGATIEVPIELVANAANHARTLAHAC